MTTAAQCEIGSLLEMAGARPAGPRRYHCPDCGGRRTVAADESKGVFNCHHAGCGFRGGIGTLRKRLGLRRERLPPAEYRELCQRRDRAHEAGQRLYAAVHSRRMELLECLELLADLERTARDAGPAEAAWDALAVVYRERPCVLAELASLENVPVADLVKFLTADAEARRRAIDRVLGGQVSLARTAPCLHCCSLGGRDLPKPGRCPGPCWRGCFAVCLECGGKGSVAVLLPLEVGP